MSETTTPGAGASGPPKLEITGSRHLTSWLAAERVSLAFTTYRVGKIFLVGLQQDGRLSINERTFGRSMGLCVAGNAIYLSSLYQLWRFENALKEGELHDGYDRLYVPQVGYTTGDIDIHDIAVDGQGRVIFVNTLFNCLATVCATHSFTPLWRPPFISKLAAEDRCHLNGLAMQDGRPRYVTAVSRSDVTDGWRERRLDGGVVVDLARDEVVLDGLSMPHSPRLHMGRLWLHNSGTGYFGYADLEAGQFEPVTFCPGYLRGLAFVDRFAVVGLSRPRQNRTFTGLELDDNLAGKDAEARCALHVIDLESGDVAHWLRIDGVIEELYDVAVLAGVRRPMALGLIADDIQRTLSVDQPGTL